MSAENDILRADYVRWAATGQLPDDLPQKAAVAVSAGTATTCVLLSASPYPPCQRPSDLEAARRRPSDVTAQ